MLRARETFIYPLSSDNRIVGDRRAAINVKEDSQHVGQDETEKTKVERKVERDQTRVETLIWA